MTKDQFARRIIYRAGQRVHKIQRELNDRLRGHQVQLTTDSREWHGGKRLKAGRPMVIESVHLQTYDANAPCLWLAHPSNPGDPVASVWMQQVRFV